MKKILSIILLSFFIGGCSGQKKQKQHIWPQLAALDTSANPKTEVHVNKKYDDNGNLIQFDSSYSYRYSSPGFNLDQSIRSDSLFGSLKSPLLYQYHNMFDTNMNNIFFSDSLFKYDFYNNDYFSRRYQLNMRRFENMFRQMDSVKSQMFRQGYPDGAIKKN